MKVGITIGAAILIGIFPQRTGKKSFLFFPIIFISIVSTILWQLHKFTTFFDIIRNACMSIYTLSLIISYVSLFLQKGNILELIQAGEKIPHDLKKSKVDLFFVIVVGIYITFVIFEFIFIYITHDVFYYDLKHICGIISLLFNLVYVELMFWYQSMIKSCRDKIKSKNCAKFANDVCDLYEKTSHIFAWTNLCLVVQSLVISVFGIYYTLRKVSWTPHPLEGLTWLGFYASKLFYVAYANAQLNGEVRLKILLCFFLVVATCLRQSQNVNPCTKHSQILTNRSYYFKPKN